MTTIKYRLPTGVLFVEDYSKGELETLSIGDYGKSKNIKADFLGYTKEVNGVPSGSIMPLQEKWVVTLSTQYGCVQKCTFCDVPNVKFSGNATFDDLRKQLYTALSLFPEVTYTDRLNVHFARMGEPVLNLQVFEFSKFLALKKKQIQEETGKRIEVIHPVLTTMCPSYSELEHRLLLWCSYKNSLFNGQAGLQLSINSTDSKQRDKMFGGSSIPLSKIARIASRLPDPVSRKYCLNFAYASGTEVDGRKLANLFDPEKWMVKITPIHNNTACAKNGYKTDRGYTSYSPYKVPEESCKEAGFDVLVFVPSQDEEDSCITCGNAILGGSQLKIAGESNEN